MQTASPGAIRFRRFYARRRSGVAVLPIEVDVTALAVIESRLIDPNMLDDRTALAKATTRLIDIFCKEKTI